MTAVLALLGNPAAHADEVVDRGTWDSGYAVGSCVDVQRSRTCTYEINYTDCREASVSTGGPMVEIPCAVHVKATVTVQPRVTAAGRVIGCTSVVGTGDGTAAFDSNVDSSFDRIIGVKDITVQSMHTGDSLAVVHARGSASDGFREWTVDAMLTATCAPGGRSGPEGQVVTAGSVTVSVATTQPVEQPARER